MQIFLLAGAAIAGLAGAASAQEPTAASLPVGLLGVPTAPSTFLGGNNIFNQDGGPMPQGSSTPKHGTSGVHPNKPPQSGEMKQAR